MATNVKHKLLIKKVRDAVENLYSDTTVSPEETFHDLYDIADEITDRMDILKTENNF